MELYMRTAWTAFKLFVLMTILLGLVYPLLITGLAQVIFPKTAGGSLVKRDEQIVGSFGIEQKFSSPVYFWGRPSAVDFNPLPSGGSNLGPISQVLKKSVDERASALRQAHGLDPQAPVPQDLLFASASGLDPDLSPEATVFQIERVAHARALTAQQKVQLEDLVRTSVQNPDLGFLGEPRVNILKLNLALDEFAGRPHLSPPAAAAPAVPETAPATSPSGQ
jgi:K+-transporting ATPase ATPase C chain